MRSDTNGSEQDNLTILSQFHHIERCMPVKYIRQENDQGIKMN